MTEAEAKPSPQGSPFWRFSLQFYRQPGVADACITLQEQSGVDVNLLMYLLWQAGQRRSFSPDEVAWLESKIGSWRESGGGPAAGGAARVEGAAVADDGRYGGSVSNQGQGRRTGGGAVAAAGSL